MANSKLKEGIMTDASKPGADAVPVKSSEIKGPIWLTRDKRNGVLREVIEVWVVRPMLHKFPDGDVMWLPPLEAADAQDTNVAEWTVAKCLKEIYTYPSTERECIHRG